MTTNRISISSSPRGPRAPHFADEPSRIASSLDAVFSYQRSAGFLAESLRSSHVDEAGNVRHPDYEDDDDDDVGSIAEQERRWRARLEEEDQDDDDEDRVGHTFSPASAGSKHNDFWTTSVSQSYDSGAESDSGPPAALLVDTAGPDSRSHALPPNALGTSPASIGVHYNDLPDSAGERSPLLGRTRSRGAMSQVGRPGAPSFLSVETNDSRAPRQRRSSVFSREAWKAKIEEHRGESTWGQTLFNCINVLVGVGLLADPLAFADAGWILGTLLLLYCALVTNYTAKMLAAMMRRNRHAMTYADILISAFGPWTRPVILALFVIELFTFSVALVELFADSMASLFPAVTTFTFKVISYAVLVPTTFLPLRILSLTSLLGIMSSFVLLAVLLADGSIKREAPGSLWQVMPTSLAPRWRRFPISFGLLMSGFSGHAVVPSLYRDMADPAGFNSMIDVAYIVASVVTLVFAGTGYLMFGGSVSSEVTRDIARTAGYPVALNKLAIWMVAINPLVKYAIASKPLVQTFETFIGSVSHRPPPPPQTDSAIADTASSIAPVPLAPVQSPRKARILRYTIYRPLLTLACVGVAILIPEFDRVLAFLGSASAFLICVIGPIGAYLKAGRRRRPQGPNAPELGRKKSVGEEDALVVDGRERLLCWFLLLLSSGMAAVGTVWSFLPVPEPAA